MHRQLPNAPHAHPPPNNSFLPRGCPRRIYAGLASLSEGCPPAEGRLHTCYSPVRQSPASSASTTPAALRLACVKPVASVHPEPGSNSPLFILFFSFQFWLIRATDSVSAPKTIYRIVVFPGLSLHLLREWNCGTCMSLYSHNFYAACLVAKCHCSLRFQESSSEPLSLVVSPETRLQN